MNRPDGSPTLLSLLKHGGTAISLLRLPSLKAPTHIPPLDTHKKGEAEKEVDLQDPIPCLTTSLSTTAPSTVRSSTASISQTASISSSTLASACSVKSNTTKNVVLEYNGGVYAAPGATMAHDDKEAWTRIRSRLENTLRHMYRPKPGLDSTISMEFMIAGPSPSSLKPSVILVCCSARCQKQLKKILKTQQWIADHDYHFLVIVDPLRELSGGDGGSATESVVEAWNVAADSALGGTLACSRGHDGTTITFTLGGVVTVNQTLYALTAGHVFRQGAVDSRVASEASEVGSSSGEDDDGEDGDDGSPFVVFDRGSNTSELDAAHEYRPPRPSLGRRNINPQDRPLCVDDIMSREGPVVLGFVYAPLGAPAEPSLDWALIKLNGCHPPAWSRNEFRPPGSSRSQIIVGSVGDTDLHSPDAGCEVWINCSVSGPKKEQVV